MKELKTIIKQELKDDENIFILREDEVNNAMGVMYEYTLDEIFNVYSGKEKVVRYWHEEGLCIIIK
jgi:hypothetical protein